MDASKGYFHVIVSKFVGSHAALSPPFFVLDLLESSPAKHRRLYVLLVCLAILTPSYEVVLL